MTRPAGVSDWVEALSTFDELVELEEPARAAHLDAAPSIVRDLLAADARAERLLSRIDAAFGAGLALGSGTGAAETDPLNLVGRTVSHFRIVEPLAHGGMGVVYRAEDTRLGRTVALKFPRDSRLLPPSSRERFLHEARIIATLDHPNLCVIHETGKTSDGHLFHAMPLYEGETLRARIERDGALPFADALRIAGQVIQGLAAAHRAGVVHRDLKPANVMLLPDGTVKILDFGLAKVSDVSLTGSSTMLGTVSYMAPEQVHGRALDGRTDLWALGVVLFEMVTGTRPFPGDQEIAVAHAIVHQDPVRASTLCGEIPAELDDMVHTLLRKNPAQRYQSADELATALARIRLDESPWAVRRRQVLRTWRRRQALRWAVLAPAALAAGASGGWLANRSLVAPDVPVAVAVLPFEATGDDEGSRYLAVGLADGIRTELARLRGLVVPGYVTSTYNDPAVKPLARIAADLEVRALLTGSVRQVGDLVRVETRLLDAGSGEPIWTGRYERPAGEMLHVQRDATRGTVEALRIRLSAAERARLERTPTFEGRSYVAYLQGRAVELAGIPSELFQRRPVENVRQAQSLYARARDLDPGFAVARARLAVMHIVSFAMYDTSQARREQARLEAETALRSDPGLAEAHEALAEYWDRGGELDKAIEESRLAIQGSPNSAELRLFLGNRYARAGRLEDAVGAFEEAMRLEPGSPNAAFMAAMYYLRLRRDGPGMRAMDRAIALAPDYHMIRVIKGHTWLRWKGLPDTLEAALRRIPEEWDPDGMATWARYTALWSQRRHADALAMLDRSRSELSRDGFVYQPMPLMRARLYEGLGDRDRARASYTVARGLLRDSVAAHPDHPGIRLALGLAYAGLGQRAQAAREARRAMELAPVAKNTTAATAFMGSAVEVLGRAGEIDAAMELVELLFSMPAGREVTVAFLRVWPGFDPLRGDSRFEEVLGRFAAR